MSPVVADFVAKVENRSALKISRKPIFGLLCCCIAFQRGYEGPCSILDETIWSLTSPGAQRISGSKNFRSPPQKDFCNKICSLADIRNLARTPHRQAHACSSPSWRVFEENARLCSGGTRELRVNRRRVCQREY